MVERCVEAVARVVANWNCSSAGSNVASPKLMIYGGEGRVCSIGTTSTGASRTSGSSGSVLLHAETEPDRSGRFACSQERDAPDWCRRYTIHFVRVPKNLLRPAFLTFWLWQSVRARLSTFAKPCFEHRNSRIIFDNKDLGFVRLILSRFTILVFATRWT